MNLWSNIQFAIIIVIDILLSFFPTADAGTITAITSQLAPFKTAIAAANWFFPVDTFFSLLSIVFVVEFGIFTYKFVKFLVKNVSLGFFRE